MRKFGTTITFLAIIAALVVLVGLLSGNSRNNKTTRSNSEPVYGQGIDAARSILMYI
jgi:hypothetical protein